MASRSSVEALTPSPKLTHSSFYCQHTLQTQVCSKNNNGQTSHPRRLKNSVPQGSSLAPILFNIYLSDIPDTTSCQYGYADDLALFFSDRRWSTVEEVLSKDTAKIANYLLKWRLRLSMAKTTTTAFHLNSKEAKCKLAITLHGTILPP